MRDGTAGGEESFEFKVYSLQFMVYSLYSGDLIISYRFIVNFLVFWNMLIGIAQSMGYANEFTSQPFVRHLCIRWNRLSLYYR